MDFVQLCRVIIGSVVMVKVVRGQVQKSPDSLRPQVLHCLVTKCLTQFVIDTCGVAGKAYYDDQKH